MSKFMKKSIALVMAIVLSLSMCIVAFAASEPSSSDTESVYVYGVEKGVTVTAYHLISATYDTNGNGLTGYSIADGIEIENIESPTAEEITTIAKQINAGEVSLESIVLTYKEASTAYYYTDKLTAGMWIILVSNANDTIYNPMIVSNWYSDANDASSLQSGAVDAAGNFVEGEWSTDDDGDNVYSGTSIYAKKTKTSIDKVIVNGNDEVNGIDLNVGDEVTFKITTTIPDYSDAYDDDTVQFIITDVMSAGLAAVSADDLTVTVGGTEFSSGTDTYSVTTTANSDGLETIVISFISDFIIEHINDEVIVTYTTTVDDDAVMAEEDGDNLNYTYLTYTNEFTTSDGGTSTTDTDPEYVCVYTFALTDELVKTSPNGGASADGTTVTVKNALEGAEFTVYTTYDSSTGKVSNVYTNNIFDGTATSDSNGYINIEGLGSGTYYLLETEAPDGYYINDTVWKLVIESTLNEDGTLASYTITISDASDTTGSTASVSTYTATYTEDSDDILTVKSYSDISVDPTVVVDAVIQKFPSTGDMGTYILLLISALACCLAAIIILRKQKTA